MKKIFTICLVGLIAFSAFGQERVYRQDLKSMPTSIKQKSVSNLEAVETVDMPYNTSSSAKAPVTIDAGLIGHTTIELQSNSMVSNRFFRYDTGYGDDRYGKLVATWMGSTTIATGSTAAQLTNQSPADRGTYSNSFNGTNWLFEGEEEIENITNLEPSKTGWPNYVPLKDGGEMIIVHNGSGIFSYKRAVFGEGEWVGPQTVADNGESDNYSWPRVCVNHETGTIHVVCAIQISAVGPTQYFSYIYYFKSEDGGETWTTPELQDHLHELIEEDRSPYAADDYVWAESNNGIIAYSLVNVYQDVIIMKSDDDGETWNKITVWQKPLEINDTGSNLTDTLYYPCGHHALAIDDYGDCHIAFNVHNMLYTTNLQYFPQRTFMMYWNEGLPPYFQANNYQALNPYMYDEYFDDGRVLLAQGFDFSGDQYCNYGGSGNDAIVDYLQGEMILGAQIAVAGPDRIIFTLEVQDETALYEGEFTHMYTRIFMCSYVFDGDNWLFDKDWVDDENMKFYDLHTEETGVLADSRGWYRVLDNASYPNTNCKYTQLCVQKTNNDTGNFYIIYLEDSMPGGITGYSTTYAGSNRNPKWLENELPTPTQQYVYTVAESVNFTGPNFPEIPGSGIANHKPAKEELVIYPNPATNMININAVEATNCVVYNMTGQVVAKQQLSVGNNTINISALKAGVYVVSAGNSNARLIVQ